MLCSRRESPRALSRAIAISAKRKNPDIAQIHSANRPPTVFMVDPSGDTDPGPERWGPARHAGILVGKGHERSRTTSQSGGCCLRFVVSEKSDKIGPIGMETPVLEWPHHDPAGASRHTRDVSCDSV